MGVPTRRRTVTSQVQLTAMAIIGVCVAVPVAFVMEAEILKGIGVTAFDDGIGLGRQFGHEVSLVCRDNIRSTPVSGTRSQSGRCASSYSIS